MGSPRAVATNAHRILAARLHAHCDPLSVEDTELPEPAEGEVRVRLRFAGINPVDTYVARGLVAGETELPRTLGGEAVGVLDGTDVLISGGGLGSQRDGVWAQAANVPRDAVHEVPKGVVPTEAAAMGIAGLTAWQVVHELAEVQAEDRVLVLGAAGGVGSIIVSLGASAGATVWGQTGSETKAALIERQGAHYALVADGTGLAHALRDFHPTVVFDPLGGEFLAPAIEALVPRGRHVTFGTSAGAEVTFNLQSLYRKSLKLLGYGGMQLGSDERRRGLRSALAALADGRLKVAVDRLYPLEQVNEALAHLGERRAQGKVLLEMEAPAADLG